MVRTILSHHRPPPPPPLERSNRTGLMATGIGGKRNERMRSHLNDGRRSETSATEEDDDAEEEGEAAEEYVSALGLGTPSGPSRADASAGPVQMGPNFGLFGPGRPWVFSYKARSIHPDLTRWGVFGAMSYARSNRASRSDRDSAH
ncbi:hypothetical protein NL676_019225 [Syzygium grande]|nr:hypothetical protein NL676_019225 [Syzygium grande]